MLKKQYTFFFHRLLCMVNYNNISSEACSFIVEKTFRSHTQLWHFIKIQIQ